MRTIWTVAEYTVREALARKIFVAFFIVSSLGVALTALIVSFIDSAQLSAGVDAAGTALGREAIVAQIFFFLKTPLVAVAILLSIFAVANLVPLMMERGTIELFLSKPVTRAEALTGRFIGGLLVVLANVFYLVFFIWVIISGKLGVWHLPALYLVLTILLAFASLNAIIVLIGVWTRSSILGMMTAYFVFLALSPALSYREYLYEIGGGDALKIILDSLYYVLPKTSEVLGSTTDALIGGGALDWQPALTTLAFTAVAFGAALYSFWKKDF